MCGTAAGFLLRLLYNDDRVSGKTILSLFKGRINGVLWYIKHTGNH